jgi:hypothetical protein
MSINAWGVVGLVPRIHVAVHVRAQMAHQQVVDLDRCEQCADAASDRSDVDPEEAQLLVGQVVQLDCVPLRDEHRVPGVRLVAVQARVAAGQVGNEVAEFIRVEVRVGAHRAVDTRRHSRPLVVGPPRHRPKIAHAATISPEHKPARARVA